MNRAALAATVALAAAACAHTPLEPGEFRVVERHAMSAYAMHQECFRAAAGERIEYLFESSEPVHFDLHYREGGATLLPVVKDGVRADAGVIPVLETRRLCLGWEAGPAGASLDYRFRVRPPGP